MADYTKSETRQLAEPPSPDDGGPETRDATRRFFPGLIVRRLILFGIAAFALVDCRWLAYQLRFDFDVPLQYQIQLQHHGWWVITLQLGCLLLFHQFSGIYKYFSVPEI